MPRYALVDACRRGHAQIRRCKPEIQVISALLPSAAALSKLLPMLIEIIVKVQSEGDIQGLGGLDEILPRSQCAQGALHMGTDESEAVDIAGVDPAKPGKPLAIHFISQSRSQPHPSRGAPLKSLPWLPYSACTLCGSTFCVTSYFSTTTPLKSTNALVTMYSHRYARR